MRRTLITLRRAAGALALGGVVLCGATIAPAAADTIYLWGSSEPIEGEVLGVDGAFLRVRKADGTEIRLERSKVKRVVTSDDAEAARKAEADRLAKEDAKRARSLSKPVAPTLANPAGGWMVVMDNKKRQIGYRHVRFYQATDQPGWILEETEYWTTEHGKPRLMATGRLRLGPEMQTLSYVSLLKMRGRVSEDIVSEETLQFGTERVRWQTIEQGVTKPAFETKMPKHCVLENSVLAMLLRGDLADQILHAKETPKPVVFHTPNRLFLRQRGQVPDDQRWPASGTITIEVQEKQKVRKDGWTPVKVKLIEAYKDTGKDGKVHGASRMITIGLKPGQPVRLLNILDARATEWDAIKVNELRRLPLYSSRPNRWVDQKIPAAPGGLGGAKSQ